MPSVTLTESARLAQDQLVAGVIENIITVNTAFQVLPFDGIMGNALAYNRENTLGDVDVEPVGETINSKGAATFTQVTSSLTTIVGDAEVNGLIQATRSSHGNDQTAVQIASKAKSAARKYQDMFITGTGADGQFNGLINLCASRQKVNTGTDGSDLTFKILDELVDRVTDKDGVVDWIMMHARTLRSYYALLRGLGGASISDTVMLPSGEEVPAYRRIPIFRNDWIPITQTKGATTNTTTTIFAGNWDDGSRQHGIAGLTAEDMAGISVIDVGEHQSKDEHIWRVRWYCGLAMFSEKGLACAEGIKD